MTEELAEETQSLFQPYVYVPDDEEEAPGFSNSIYLSLDARMRSDMNWGKAKEKAKVFIAKGLKILWHLEMGLFSSLDYPYQNEMQFQSLALSLNHFKETLWEEFKEHTAGISIYSGSIDFSKDFKWDGSHQETYQHWIEKYQMQDGNESRRLFCCGTASDYLRLLSQGVPDSLPLYICLNKKEAGCDPLEIFRFTSKERFDRFNILYKEENVLIPLENKNEKIGLCLPEISFVSPVHYEGLAGAIQSLEDKKLPYRVIPEPYLITEWDGLDFLIYTPSGLTPQGKRKLLGFCAAGGMVISTGKLLGLPLEMKIDDFMISC